MTTMKVSITLNEDILKKVQKLAKKNSRSVSNQINYIIESYKE
jgi:hypothetical protein